LAEENPRDTIHSRHQQQFGINVLAGIVGDCLVALHIFPQRQTGSVERDFRLNGLPRLLKKNAFGSESVIYTRRGRGLFF
jgi:hypothetical protein